MPWIDDWNFGAEEDPEYRRRALENKLLKPLGISLTDKSVIGGKPESPADQERNAAKVKLQLAKEDQLFGVFPGCTIEARYKLPRGVTAGDPDADARDDRDPELASMDEARR